MMILLLIGAVIWFYLFFVSLTNALILPRAKPGAAGKVGTVLIPARNEAENLKTLLPALAEEAEQIIVFDDQSTDGTAEVAQSLGATVIRGSELPDGWTGKNFACYSLAKTAAEVSPSEWWVFLDADTIPQPGFGSAIQGLIDSNGGRFPVITGFPKLLPGKFPEPIYLFWVPWALLSVLPMGIAQSTGKGHAKFTNGQFVVWKANRYFEINPHESCKGEVLEDIQIGRLLAREKIPVLVANLSSVLHVAMYQNLSEAWRGMNKNAFWVTGSRIGALLTGVILVCLTIAPVLSMGTSLAAAIGFMMLASALATQLVVRAPIYTIFTIPLSILAAATTQFMAAVRGGKSVEWKGRTY
ncbi:MAG: glycosyltransferase [Fimbriimonadaceae bacterium]|nr:MAG: glycosyltransferase [Fimbriimonadaceae bacterium]